MNCKTCGGGELCIHDGEGNSQFAQDCIDNNYRHYKPCQPKTDPYIKGIADEMQELAEICQPTAEPSELRVLAPNQECADAFEEEFGMKAEIIKPEPSENTKEKARLKMLWAKNRWHGVNPLKVIKYLETIDQQAAELIEVKRNCNLKVRFLLAKDKRIDEQATEIVDLKKTCEEYRHARDRNCEVAASYQAQLEDKAAKEEIERLARLLLQATLRNQELEALKKGKE